MLDPRTGRARQIFSGGPGRIGSATFTRDGSIAVIEAQPNLSTWPMDTQWGSVQWALRASGQTRTAAAEVPLNALLFPSDRNGVIYVAGYPTRSLFPQPQQLTELTLATATQVPLTTPELPATRYTISDDGATIVAVLENLRTVPELYVWTSVQRQWRKLTDNRAAVRSDWGQGISDYVSWRSKDDLCDVDGLVVRPRNFQSDKRYPLIVLLMGGTATSTVPWSNVFDPAIGRGVGGPPAFVYADAGYVVLMPNDRDVQGASAKCIRALIGHYGDHVSKDIEAGIDELVRRGWVDAGQIALVGNSHGSDEVMYAITHSQRYKAAVLVDGPVGMPDVYLPMMDAFDDGLGRWYGSETMRRLIGFDPVRKPWADPFDIRTPMLVRWADSSVEGTPPATDQTLRNLNNVESMDDSFDSRLQAAKLLYALGRNGVPIDMVVDHDAHSFISYEYLPEWQSRLIQWFDYFLQRKGENPIPAMRSPVDYSEALKKYQPVAPAVK
jgi:pimeloyl-ACP methyl ester carboxylesterase